MDRIDAMRLFLRVADAGSFSRAANDLTIGQPTVSRRIQDLEHRLGAELFHRTTRSLSLTEAGQRFYERARAILSEFDDAEAEARGLEHEPVGLLRMSTTHSLGRLVITPAVSSFLKLYPHIRIDMLLDDAVTDLVGEGVDLAFRLGVLTDSSLMAKRIGEARRGAWASPVYLSSRDAPKHPDDLSGHDLIGFRQGNSSGPWTFVNGEQTVEIKRESRFVASSGEVLAEAAVDGLGVILVPDWVARPHAEAGRLVRVLPEWSAPPLAINAVWTNGRLKGKSKLFVEHLADALRFAPLP